ncbi:MAG: EI24 domain-containing protein [Sumerlaeia bacterium]
MAEVSAQPIVTPDLPLGFRRGLQAPFRALRYLLTRPKCVLILMAPIAIVVLLLLPLTYEGIMAFLFNPLEQFLPVQGQGLVKDALYWLGLGALWIMVAALLLIAFLLYTAIVAAPFHDYVSELIEREQLAGRPDLTAPGMPLMRSVVYSLGEALMRVLIAIPVVVTLLCLNLIPFVGTGVSAIGNLMFAAAFLALDSFTYSFDRRHVKMRRKWKWVREHFKYAVGFGLPFVPIPCALILAPPLGAVAATLDYCDLLKSANPAPGAVKAKSID